MTFAARVRAQAKVNLRLRILSRETSGYHSLETIFLRLDLADDVRVRLTAGRTLDCAGPAMPPEGLGPTEENLAFRAANAYAAATGWPNGFAIELMKRIPVGGGLGGGSADAGAVLRALDAMSPRPLGVRLVELAAPLGADVPFMSIEKPMALAWGRGERMMPLRPLEARPVLLVVPPFAVATAGAYGWLAADRGEYRPAGELIAPESLDDWESIAGIASNDFEPVIGRRHPVVSELVGALRSAGAAIAMLSGSGSAVFGVFGTPEFPALIPPAGAKLIETRSSTRVERVEVEQ